MTFFFPREYKMDDLWENQMCQTIFQHLQQYQRKNHLSQFHKTGSLYQYTKLSNLSISFLHIHSETQCFGEIKN